ncbi:MAG: Ig-like domain-containing protein [Myxococcota bacterium]
MKRTLIVLLGLTALGGLLACGAPSADRCTFDADCAEPREFCDTATLRCVAHECIDDSMCSSARVCNRSTNSCERPTPSSDMPADVPLRPADLPADLPPPDMPLADTTPPEVLRITPAAGSDIARDQTFTLTFSEPLDPLSVSEFSIILQDAAGDQVALDIDYDRDVTVALTPNSMLHNAKRYTLVLKTFLRDLALNDLAMELRFDY